MAFLNRIQQDFRKKKKKKRTRKIYLIIAIFQHWLHNHFIKKIAGKETPQLVNFFALGNSLSSKSNSITIYVKRRNSMAKFKWRFYIQTTNAFDFRMHQPLVQR